MGASYEKGYVLYIYIERKRERERERESESKLVPIFGSPVFGNDQVYIQHNKGVDGECHRKSCHSVSSRLKPKPWVIPLPSNCP